MVLLIPLLMFITIFVVLPAIGSAVESTINRTMPCSRILDREEET